MGDAGSNELQVENKTPHSAFKTLTFTFLRIVPSSELKMLVQNVPRLPGIRTQHLSTYSPNVP